MHAVSFSNGNLRASDRAHRYGASGLTVDPDGRREGAAVILGPGIKNIAMFGVAGEIGEVDNAIGNNKLGLDAVLRH